jgi:RIO kinase 1
MVVHMTLDRNKYRFLESRIDSLKEKDKDSEARKTYSEVFDDSTLLTLYKLFTDGVLEIVDYPIATGKEGNVYKGLSPEKEHVAVKIFRTSTSTFKHLSKYIAGDKRFSKIKPKSRNMIHTWAQKEFRNLVLMHDSDVRVPGPRKCIENVLVMDYVGDENKPAPLLRTSDLKDPMRVFSDVVANMKKINSAGLVHADLSEYNILMWNDLPYIIDVGQALPLDSPSAEEFFLRDVRNVVRYFSGHGVKTTEHDIVKEVRGD